MFAGIFGSQPKNRKASNDSSRPALVPPFPHPLPHKHVAIADLGTEGLVLYPYQDKAPGVYKGKAALISYGKSGNVRSLEGFDSQSIADKARCTSYGVLGILKLFQENYLLVISSRRNVGQYLNSDKKTINCLTGILAIPLVDAAKARDVLSEQHKHQKSSRQPLERSLGGLSDISRSSAASSTDSSDVEDEHDHLAAGPSSGNTPAALVKKEQTAETESLDSKASLAEQKAKRSRPSVSFGLGKLLWPSLQAKHTAEASELVKLASSATPPISATSQSETEEVVAVAEAAQKVPVPSEEAERAVRPADPEAASMVDLDKKILREALAELANGAMYYSQDFDLTRCTQKRWLQLKEEKLSARSAGRSPKPKQAIPLTGKAAEDVDNDEVLIDMRKEEPSSMLPLAQRADRRFWWNNWLSKPLIDAGLDEFVTVLMQGFVQVQSIPLVQQATSGDPHSNDTPLTLAVISRRSVERPGLRYQRRGINAAGEVANFVETEFLVSCETAAKHQISSYVQTRGSIPLYWSQSPWSLKPVPVLERSTEENSAAITKHFEKQTRNYFGKAIIVNLAEQEGNEGLVVKAYRDAVAALNKPEVKYTEWDFHGQCKGMRYENIARLMEERADDIEHLSSFWSLDSQKLQLQTGVFRTNCMDCLDRTNVVQSAFARNHLATFLVHAGIGPVEPRSQEQLDLTFNAIFADNGDAISRTYAGTSALKGDFVRSGKRNWRGQFNDATNSLARFYQNTVLDFFKQSMIDYVTGLNLNAFAEFGEKMQSSDPGEIVRLSNIRKNAIETASKTVIAEGETCLHAWALLSPAESGHIKDMAFEEKILLVTRQAIYCCSFEYTLQKVRDFTKVPIGQVVGLQKGEYILSALDASARDAEENYGLVIRYLPVGAVSRSRSYSMRNKSSPTSPVSEGESKEEPVLIAFKAIRGDMIRDLEGITQDIKMSCRQQVDTIVEQLRQACEDVGSTDSNDSDFVTQQPIVSLSEAKAQVGMLERLNHELKHMIWL